MEWSNTENSVFFSLLLLKGATFDRHNFFKKRADLFIWKEFPVSFIADAGG